MGLRFGAVWHGRGSVIRMLSYDWLMKTRDSQRKVASVLLANQNISKQCEDEPSTSHLSVEKNSATAGVVRALSDYIIT